MKPNRYFLRSALLFSIILSAAITANAAIVDITFDRLHPDTLVVHQVVMADLSTNYTNPSTDTIAVPTTSVNLRYNITEPCRLEISPLYQDYNSLTLYVNPDDTLSVTVEKRDLRQATVIGSEIMEEISRFKNESKLYIDSIKVINERISASYRFNYDYTLAHRNEPIAIYSLARMPVEMATTIADSITDNARTSIMHPIYERIQHNISDYRQMQRTKATTDEGNTAPEFTLTDINGDSVSLSQFRGKWVLIDFWGTWCGWCLKGFPDLQDFHSAYSDKCTVIGIDIKDHEETWREFVTARQLPWLNLWNDPSANDNIERTYAIESCPTKLLIDPAGIIRLKIIGETPEFYQKAKAIFESE